MDVYWYGNRFHTVMSRPSFADMTRPVLDIHLIGTQPGGLTSVTPMPVTLIHRLVLVRSP